MAAGTATLIEQPVTFSQDDDGHRTYTVTYQVITDDTSDSVGIVYNAVGLPALGANFTSVGFNEVDDWAFHSKTPSIRYRSNKLEGGGHAFLVDCEFSTRPAKRCRTNQIENPLNEPYRLSGGFNKFTRNADQDSTGNAIVNPAFEPIKGKAVEVDDNRPTLRLGVNWATFNLAFAAEYTDAVNDDTWWGLPARTIKCSDISWERVLYGTCSFYYRIDFVFEAKFDKWDRVILNEGTKHFDPNIADNPANRANPTNYIQYTDKPGNYTSTLLDQQGSALVNGAAPTYSTFRIYKERDFSAAGWPDGIFT